MLGSFSHIYFFRSSPAKTVPLIEHDPSTVVEDVHRELTVSDEIRLIIPKLIRAIRIPTTMRVIFFFASLTSAHFADSIIHIIPLKMTIVTANTIVILRRNFAILTINGASVLRTVVSRSQPKTSEQKSSLDHV
jgi:hypothetical protein